MISRSLSGRLSGFVAFRGNYDENHRETLNKSKENEEKIA
jgi:hypothetical protein